MPRQSYELLTASILETAWKLNDPKIARKSLFIVKPARIVVFAGFYGLDSSVGVNL